MTLITWQDVAKDLGPDGEFEAGNIRCRPNFLPKIGDKIDGHEHNFDHATLFLSGKFLVIARKKGVKIAEEVVTAPNMRLILADTEHEIIALVENSAFWCVYSHRNAQGKVIQRNEGYSAAYV